MLELSEFRLAMNKIHAETVSALGGLADVLNIRIYTSKVRLTHHSDNRQKLIFIALCLPNNSIMTTTCKGTTKRGTACKNKVRVGLYCRHHKPADTTCANDKSVISTHADCKSESRVCIDDLDDYCLEKIFYECRSKVFNVFFVCKRYASLRRKVLDPQIVCCN